MELLRYAYFEHAKRVLGKADSEINRLLPPLMVRMNMTASESGACSCQVTVPEIGNARKAFEFFTMCIVRKPGRTSSSAIRYWHWGFPSVYWFQDASENKRGKYSGSKGSKGGKGFRSSGPRDLNFFPCVVCAEVPESSRFPQVEFSRIGIADLVQGFEQRDGWAGQHAWVTV